jgi:syntaxin 16
LEAIRRSENYVKTIATIGNDGSLSSQERTTRLNVMRSLGTELAQASKSFRHIQKDFFRNLREQEKIGEQYFTSADGSAAVSIEDALNNELTESQVAELAQIEAQSSDREKEIIKIAQSVNELATLFKELNMLVIEQGTILDRIDYNIETSLSKIKKGVVDLEDAEKQSKRALGFRCLLIMIIIVAVLFIVFVIRKSI